MKLSLLHTRPLHLDEIEQGFLFVWDSIGSIGSFKEYTASVAIFGQQLNTFEMNTVVGYIYDQIGLAKYGRAAAGALILFMIILAFTIFNNWVSSKKVHY